MTSVVMAGGSERRCCESLIERVVQAYYADDRDEGDEDEVLCEVCGRPVAAGEWWPSDDGPLCEGCYLSQCWDG